MGLFGERVPDTVSSVQQRRQELNADQQTASQFSGALGRQSDGNDETSSLATDTTPPTFQQSNKAVKAERKKEAQKDRDQVRHNTTHHITL